MIYAPVCIPTLNRYHHFRNCLESLESCTGAEYTDVYVALDYPPSEKYIDGWMKVNDYLSKKEQSHNFKKLIVIRRNFNYGLFGASRNFRLLQEEVLSKYDRFIASEDDNVFSPNFLEYMNKGLELYKNDKRVYAICGYKNDFKCKVENNNHFAQYSMFQAWGYGTWSNRFLDTSDAMTPAFFKHILANFSTWRKCYKYWPVWSGFIIRNAKSTDLHLPLHDINVSYYMVTTNKYVICPTISKVRNMGIDNDATTTKLSNGRMAERASIEQNMVIDKNTTFEYQGNPYCYTEENSYNTAKWDQIWEGKVRTNIFKAYIRVLLYKLGII